MSGKNDSTKRSRFLEVTVAICQLIRVQTQALEITSVLERAPAAPRVVELPLGVRNGKRLWFSDSHEGKSNSDRSETLRRQRSQALWIFFAFFVSFLGISWRGSRRG